jgi:hypothetical protein
VANTSEFNSRASGDQFEAYDRIKNELQSRKELLLKNSPQDGQSGNEMINQLIQKIDHARESIEIKASKTKILQSLLEQYNKNYDVLNKYFKESSTKLERIDINSSTSSAKLPHSLLIQNSMQYVQEIRDGLVDTQQTLLNQILTPCLNEILNNFVVNNLFSHDQYEQLEADLSDLKADFEGLIALTESKQNEMAALNECSVRYGEMKRDFEEWLQAIELKIQMFEPIAIDIEVVEKQYDQLQTAIDEYQVKATDSESLNQLANQYLSLIAKSKPNSSAKPYSKQRGKQSKNSNVNR